MLDRRQFLTTVAALSAAGGLAPSLSSAQTAPVTTNARIVIIGAGAAGTALANRLVRRLDGASVTLIDPRPNHLYQPGLTLVAAGLKPADYVVSRTAEWLPRDVSLIAEAVVAVDPEAKTVETSGGQSLDYDWLIVAPGLVLDHDAIEGFSLDMVGENGIGALYAGPEYAARTWQAAQRFTHEGGTGLFTRPATEMKCAGAPLKHAFLLEDIGTRAGNRSAMNMIYAAPQASLFGVPIVAEKVRMLFDQRDINAVHGYTLKAIDAGRRRATFQTADGDAEMSSNSTSMKSVVSPAAARSVSQWRSE